MIIILTISFYLTQDAFNIVNPHAYHTQTYTLVKYTVHWPLINTNNIHPLLCCCKNWPPDTENYVCKYSVLF